MFHKLTFSAAFNYGATEEESDPSLHDSTVPHHAGHVVICIFPPHFPVLSECVNKVLVFHVRRCHLPLNFNPFRARGRK